MIELFTAKSGALSMKVDGVAMHSPYDPTREADRFVRETFGSDVPSTVVVLGECAGHVSSAVSRLQPRATVITAVYSEEIARAAPLRGTISWHPGAPLTFLEFLRINLGELQIEGLRVVEWPPAARAFPEAARAANEALRQVVQELNGSFVTTVAAGRLWLRNALANFLSLSTVLAGRLCAPGRPVVIAAPGPSLEEARPLLSEMRPCYELWALPSSCPFLMDSRLLPDLVVVTDPGFYSMHHLHFPPPACPVAMPLSAARGAWSLPTGPGRDGIPVFLLEQPVLFERALLAAAGVVAPLIPPHGTVAASAIDLALASTSGPVIVTGLDMAARDLLSHARPNAFDRLLHLQASRLQPHTSLCFHRAAALGSAPGSVARGLRVTPALRTYAGWFTAQHADAGGTVHRLLPSAIPIRSMPALDAAGFRDLMGTVPATGSSSGLNPRAGYPSGDERRRIVSRLLKSWTTELAAARDSLDEADVAQGLGDFPGALAFAHFIAPRRLVDVMKKARLGHHQTARIAAGEMFGECIGFLDSLGGKIVG
ncbi:MAG: hypothetical protein ACLQDL_06860 [Spirochaetia bacterium]